MSNFFRKHKGVSNRYQQRNRRLAQSILSVLLALAFTSSPYQEQNQGLSVSAQASTNRTYLPLVTLYQPLKDTPAFHIPFIDDDSSTNVMTKRYSELGILWFGKVTPTENFTNIRFGYNRYVLFVDIASVDNQLWYDQSSPPSTNFSSWDSASLYISVPSTSGQESRQIRLDAELSHWQDRNAYQIAYQKNGAGWSAIDFPFVTVTGWWGEGMNGPEQDEGWHVTYRIPFSSLGLSSLPNNGSKIKMGIVVHDKDFATGSQPEAKSWPNGLQELDEASYGQFTFGYPTFQRPSSPTAGKIDIKQNSHVTVEDASVGGYTTCGNYGKDKWTLWGDRVYNQPPENETVVIQNQSLIADFPCFSRYYITFPLDAIPAGKKIASARLTLRQFGGSDPTKAQPSYIQVLRVNEPWSPSTISWNNSPQAVENYPGTWVLPLASYPGVPGIARTWDVSQAVADVYGSDRLLRLALYSADYSMHSGKYFWSSETASWSSITPPTLSIEWVNP